MNRYVLMIDDDIALAKLVQEFLINEGWAFEWIDNGEAARDKILFMKPDIILLDLALPGVGGIELCRNFKSDPRLSNIPIMILTGAYREIRDRVRGIEGGADDYLLKPFDLDVLAERLTALSKAKHKAA